MSVTKELGEQLLNTLRVSGSVRCSLAMQVTLFRAITLSRVDVCQSLVDSGCDVNARDGPESQPPLLQAAVLGDLAAVRLLLAKNATLDPEGVTPSPLLAAMEHDHAHVAFELLRHGASPQATNAKVERTSLEKKRGKKTKTKRKCIISFPTNPVCCWSDKSRVPFQ